jgi:DNA-binding transcriptional regulator YiaG
MANFASALKDEIVRLARKEVRQEVEGLKKTSAKYRSEIAALKRQVAALEKSAGRLEKKASKMDATLAEGEGATRYRFSAKRLAAQRQKLGLSAVELGTLIGVAAQTIYNWESGKSRPRQQQMAAIAASRKMGKRQIQAQLATIANG